MRRTRRRRIPVQRISIPPNAIEPWQKGDRAGLRRVLGIPPWNPSPFDVKSEEPPAHYSSKIALDGWRKSWAFRQTLIELAGKPGRAKP